MVSDSYVYLKGGGDMRHVVGVVLAVAMAAALFFAGTWGYLRLLRVPASGGSLAGLPHGALTSNHNVLIAFGAVLGTGLLLGVLMSVPAVSPLATGLPGLGLLGWTVLFLLNVQRAVNLIPLKSHPFGAGFEDMLINGILALVGLAMIIPLFVPSRWRGRRQNEEEELSYPVTTGLLS
jgi:hypothetical protein